MKLELVREPSKEFPEIDNPQQYTELKVWYSKYTTLKNIDKFVNLERLEIAGMPDADLDFLADLNNLVSIRLLHLPKVTSLEPLATLTQLEELSLETLPSWDGSGKKTKVRSFKPLSRLDKLKKVTLYGVVPEDGDYDCIKNKISLKH